MTPWLQHIRLPCASLSPRACSNSCPLSQWCYPTISSSVAPFSSCLQSFPASGSCPLSRFFTSGGQSIGALASVLSVNIQCWFPLGLTVLISLLSKGLSKSLLQHHSSKKGLVLQTAPTPDSITNTSDQQAYGRKQRGTKEPLDDSERGEWKSWFKTQHSEN